MHPADYRNASDGEPDADDVERRTSTVDAAGHGQRIDKWLVGVAPEFSRSHLQTLIALGHVRVDDLPVLLASRKLRLGQRVAVDLVPTAESLAFRAEPMVLPIVHEDDSLIVIDKPAGLVVHPAAGHWSGTLLNGLLAHHAAAATLPRAGIVHRLDKDTSGLMVVGKTLAAVTALSRAIARREVQREYVAIAHGVPGWITRDIDAPIGRDPQSRVRMAVVASGKPALTHVERLAATLEHSLLRCTLHTGRTHQIRVHLASIGHALVADVLYGGAPALGLVRQALHARRLALVHPASGAGVSWHSELPADLHAAWPQAGVLG